MSNKSRKKANKEEVTSPKGEWEYFPEYDTAWEQDIYTINTPILEDFVSVHRSKNTPDQDELVAILIVDAGNTYQKCHELPSNLLEQRNKAIELLKKIYGKMNAENFLEQDFDEVETLINNTYL